jgi:hypothetical protein
VLAAASITVWEYSVTDDLASAEAADQQLGNIPPDQGHSTTSILNQQASLFFL